MRLRVFENRVVRKAFWAEGGGSDSRLEEGA